MIARIRNLATVGGLATVLLVAAGCDSLEQTDPNNPTADTFWDTEEAAILGINAAYHTFHLFGTYQRYTFMVWDQRSDVSFSTSPWADLANVSKFTFSSYDFEFNAGTWNDHYSGVFRANQVITYVPDIDMNPALRDRIVAEAKFIRALLYFNLTSLYGDVPMPLELQSPEDRPEQVPQAQVWAQVEQDLTEARQALPRQYAGDDVGRATWGAATALLARAHMQQREWAEATRYYEEVIDSGLYSLEADYADLFDDVGENGPESIFEIQYTDDSRLAQGVYGDWRSQQCGPPLLGWGDCQPTQWFFDEFFEEQTVEGNVDPRVDANFFWRGSDQTVYGRTYGQVYTDGRTTPYWKKYTEYYNAGSRLDAPINQLVIRYGMVLLHYAEALTELGRQSEAYPYVDQIRQRVNLAPLSEIRPGLGQAEMREQIEHEQLTEMGGENTRWLYILRHRLYETELPTLIEHDPEFRFFEPGRQYLPIPQSEVDLNPNVTQNPGW